MQFYCEICKENTRHKWDDYSNRFECIRKTEAHGWHKKNVMEINNLNNETMDNYNNSTIYSLQQRYTRMVN